MMHADDNTINAPHAVNPRAAIFDARRRSQQAETHNSEFFSNPAHVEKLNEVYQIVDSFFTVRKGIYVNHRTGHGTPFSVVKVDGCDFPQLPRKTVDAIYREPLKELGIEPIFSKRTNSYLFRVF